MNKKRAQRRLAIRPAGTPSLRATTLVVAIAALINVMAAPAAAREIQTPNSRVVLDLPDAYAPASRFSGFVNRQVGSSVVILDFPVAAYAELRKQFTAANLAKRGIENVVKGSLSRSDDHIYMRARQVAGGRTFAKFFAIIKNDAAAALITFNVPEAEVGRTGLSQAQVEDILVRARLADQRANSRDLFKLGYNGQLKLAGRVFGTNKLYNLTGTLPDKPFEGAARQDPFFFIAPSHSPVRIVNLEAFARKAVLSLRFAKNITVRSATALKIDGRDAIALVAHGEEREGGVLTGIYQVVVPLADGNYFRMIGVAPLPKFAIWQPEFEKMARSFTRLPAP
ncbi:MAG: hypothetical protein AAFR04_10975 [Pseudomonadota bacterium]